MISYSVELRQVLDVGWTAENDRDFENNVDRAGGTTTNNNELMDSDDFTSSICFDDTLDSDCEFV